MTVHSVNNDSGSKGATEKPHLPPAKGELVRSTSPSFRLFPCNSSWYLTDQLIDPRWTGTNGAFATRSPVGEKTAQEKSSRSFIFVLIAVCLRERPIASAIHIKRLELSGYNYKRMECTAVCNMLTRVREWWDHNLWVWSAWWVGLLAGRNIWRYAEGNTT